uniref:Uncharacterized protein n=1 Tax=Arundo donax TaxID=35708 RepID=A0A0A8Y1V3_ARUDO
MYQTKQGARSLHSSNQTTLKGSSHPEKDHPMKDQLILDRVTPQTKQAGSVQKAIKMCGCIGTSK